VIRYVRATSAALIAVGLFASASAAIAFDTRRPDIGHFVDHMAEAHGFERAKLRKLLKAAQSQPAIIEAMDKPAEKAKPWFEYRSIFVTDKRIQAGVDFWLAHRPALDQASIQSGVAPEYLVAILGVETFYGQRMGHYRVIEALATLAFDYPARSKFFSDELEQFLLLTREGSIDSWSAMGSYAGAMGAPQFMPSNYRKYALDASGDGHVDLWNNWPDVLASVGNYFKQHGWISGEAVLTEANMDSSQDSGLDGRKLTLDETVGSLKAKAVSFDSALPEDAPALLIAVDEADGTHWRVGYKNFYVITRYNHSALYALAVQELASAVKSGVLARDAGAVGAAPAAAPAGSGELKP
jgi:membrane-bound lytic murein transglycosylase B